MKFEYKPETGELSVYATTEEFQLASRPISPEDADKHCYRVISKSLRQKDGATDIEAMYEFINQYVKFVQRIFADLHPEEKIKDIVIFSTMAKVGYMWTSLYDFGKNDSSYNFMEMIVSYALNVIESEGEDIHGESFKNLMETLSERDFAKLTLAKVLLSSMENPGVWKVKKKPEDSLKRLTARATALKKKVAKFEKRYGFDSSQMEKYYANDEYPEKDFGAWIEAWEELKAIDLTQTKHELAEDLVTTWSESFD